MHTMNAVRRRLLFVVAVGVTLTATTGAAQTYDPARPTSPLVLLDAPRDGVGYYALKERARERYRQEQWAEADPLVEQLARDYPRDPENWDMLGETKAKLKKWSEARRAYQRAGPLIGWDVEYGYGYLIAVTYAQEGNVRAALDALRDMVLKRHGYHRARLADWPELAPLHDHPEFRELIGRPDTRGWSRQRGWAYDLDYLYSEVQRVNPDYRDRPFPAELTRRHRELKRSIATASDESLYVGMRRMLAVLHQGHVAFWPWPRSRFLPLRFYAFPEGIYVIETDSTCRDLAGARVLRIGTLTPEEALRRISQARSVDGDMQYVWGVSELDEMALLQGIGAATNRDSVALVVEQRGIRRTVSVTSRADEIAGRMDRLVAPPGVRTPPLFLSHLDRKHWDVPLPELDALYVQVNNLSNQPGQTLEHYGRRLWSVIEKAKPANLVLDLRHNNGGTTQLYPELLRTLVAFARVSGHRTYVLIGRRSYSATGNLVTDLERLVDPVFVGEATSECCNLYGDPTYIVLPYTGQEVEATALKWQLSTPSDRRREMSPEVPVQLTARAYFEGRDPVMEAVSRLIKERRR